MRESENSCIIIWSIRNYALIFGPSTNNKHAMTAIELTPENIARIEALKKVHHSNWNGNVVHRNLEACLAAINLGSANSGWYKPAAVRIHGLVGIYMLNSDGTLFYDARVAKEGDDQYRIEHLIGNGFREFEQAYSIAIRA